MSLPRSILVLVGAFSLALPFGVWSVDAQSADSARPDRDRTLSLANAELDALIQASRVINLSAAVDGVLESVTVERGDLVAKDQVVAQLESAVEAATLELAQARVKMEAEERSRRARLAFLTSKLAREEELHTRGIVSDDELDLARTERAVAEEAVLEAAERRQLAVLEKKRAAANLARRTIRSPIDGVVTERTLSRGELVTRQHQSKILQLAQINPLHVEVIIPAELFGQVAIGDRASVIPVGFVQHRSSAVVKTVDRVIDAASDTFRVTLELPNPEHQVPPGIRGRVRFQPSS